jgi:hypothetical protein
MEEQGAARALTGRGQRVCRHHAERHACVDDPVRELLGGGAAALDDRVEPDLLGVSDALRDLREAPALEEIGDVDDVPRGAQVVREGVDAVGQSQGVVEQDQLGHGR